MENIFYHVLNRGVDKRDVFLDDKDRFRFIHDMYAFNDVNHVQHSSTKGRVAIDKPREPLITLHAFALMQNHFHLLISPVVENGMALFMKKLCMGYAKYFNERYTRSGALWQGKYKRIHILHDEHFLYIPYYIHLNPLDLQFPEWRNGTVTNVRGALKYLSTYRWSSHLDYMHRKNFPSLINRSYIAGILGSPKKYRAAIAKLICDESQSGLGEFIEN